jgi:hypothetical protein
LPPVSTGGNYQKNVMKGRTIILIPTFILLPLLAITVLILLSMGSDSRRTGFDRKFIARAISQVSVYEENSRIASIAETGEGDIFILSDYPYHWTILDRHFKILRQYDLYVPIADSVSPYLAFLDFPQLYFMGMSNRDMVAINLLTDSIRQFPLPGYTGRAAHIRGTKFMFQTDDSSGANTVFKVVDLLSGDQLQNNNITDRNNDGGLSTDGMLRYDRATGKVLYIFYYSNQFLCLDTNLNLIYKENTIDTFNSYQVTVKRTGGAGKLSFTHASPPRTINKLSCLKANLLYINSGVKADNENTSEFRNNSVIDIYRVDDGKYLGSFYLPDYKKKKPSKFIVAGSFMFAVYGNDLVSYRLDLPEC